MPEKNKKPLMVSVDAQALGQVLHALSGPSHHITELQVTRDLDLKGLSAERNPINLLIEQYNAFVEQQNKEANQNGN